MTDATCQFSAYLIYWDIFSLFLLKSKVDLKMAYVPIRYRGEHIFMNYLPLVWKHLHHYQWLFVQSL